MKSLLGILVMTASVTANAGTLAYNQLISGLNGPDCLNVAEATLKQIVNPSWYDTLRTVGVADYEAYKAKDAIETNVATYEKAFSRAWNNLAVVYNKNSSVKQAKYALQDNTYIQQWVNANLDRHATENEVGQAAANCIRQKVNFSGTITPKTLRDAEAFITRIKGSVN